MKFLTEEELDHLERWIESERIAMPEEISLISALIREAKRSRSIARGETHSPDCWDWGKSHYECAVEEIKRLQEFERAHKEKDQVFGHTMVSEKLYQREAEAACIARNDASFVKRRLDEANESLRVARLGWIKAEAWNLYEGGKVPASVKDAEWWNWDYENPRYWHELAKMKWGQEVAKDLIPLDDQE